MLLRVAGDAKDVKSQKRTKRRESHKSTHRQTNRPTERRPGTLPRPGPPIFGKQTPKDTIKHNSISKVQDNTQGTKTTHTPTRRTKADYSK